ncbi:MAG: glycosyltransferase [bacterium]
MKILQINKLYYPSIGGIETIVKQIAEGINNVDDVKIDVLACNDTGKTTHTDINGVPVTKASSIGVFFSMPVSFSFFLILRNIYKKYDIIHVHLPFPLAELGLWLIKPKQKIIVTYHSDIIRQRFLSFALRRFNRWLLSRANRIVVSNPNIVETSPVLKDFKTKCTVIPFGVDTKKFNPDNGSKQKIGQIRTTYGEKIVLFVGRLVYYKGIEFLIDAMKNIDATLLVIGEGVLKKSLMDRIQKLGLAKRVSFLPHQTQDELVNFYLASTVLVLPSIYRSEAFGIVLLEAMACGLPVISTELGTGTSYVNQNGVTGYVVPPGNSDAINMALKKLLSDKELCVQMGNAALKRIRTLFTLTNMLDNYKRLYKNIYYE